jgi:hypothetical protein
LLPALLHQQHPAEADVEGRIFYLVLIDRHRIVEGLKGFVSILQLHVDFAHEAAGFARRPPLELLQSGCCSRKVTFHGAGTCIQQSYRFLQQGLVW